VISCGVLGGYVVVRFVVWVVVLWWRGDGDVWCLVGFSEAAYVAAAGSSGGSPVIFMGFVVDAVVWVGRCRGGILVSDLALDLLVVFLSWV
jgi:hypothetical protein